MGMCTYYLTAARHMMCSNHVVAKVETQLELRVKNLQNDQGRKDLSNMFKGFYEEKGI